MKGVMAPGATARGAPGARTRAAPAPGARAAPARNCMPVILVSSRLPSSSDSCGFLKRFLKVLRRSLARGEECEGDMESSECSERRSPSSCRNLRPGVGPGEGCGGEGV